MTRKTRLILLLICVALFLVVAPYIVLYSLGYRVDFVNRKITVTGGIYVVARPAPANIAINSITRNTTGFFSEAVFVQNLLPGQHSVSIKKDGYFDYQKTLLVREKEVTKLEEVTLFKKEPAFAQLLTTEEFELLTKKPVDQFIIKTGSLYYANTPENAELTALQKSTPIIKNIVAFEVSGNSILWLGTDGLLYRFDITARTSEPLSQTPYTIAKKKTYILKTVAGNTFLLENTTALLFNKTTTAFEPFYTGVKDLVGSPDNQKIAYYSDNELWYWVLNAKEEPEKFLLQKTKDNITNVYWINNNYLLFLAGNTITITEIDTRGNVNAITLPQTISLATGDITIKNPQIFFNGQDKKLYILSGEAVYVSEKLIP